MKRNQVPIVILGAWDTAWKVAAIRRAIKGRQYRWIAPLAIVNSVGILPMLYLWLWAKPQERADEGTEERAA